MKLSLRSFLALSLFGAALCACSAGPVQSNCGSPGQHCCPPSLCNSPMWVCSIVGSAEGGVCFTRTGSDDAANGFDAEQPMFDAPEPYDAGPGPDTSFEIETGI